MVDRDKVDYRDKTPFDQEKLQDLQTIKDAILHKQFGKDVRAPIAQLPDALIKLLQDANTPSDIGVLAEIIEARGGLETLGLHEQAQNSAIEKVVDEVKNARSNNSGKTYGDLKQRLDNQENDLTRSMNDKIAQISSVPETFTDLAALKSAYPNGRTGLFVTADNGHKYIWSNNVWKDAGVYQSAGLADASVTGAKLDPKIRGLGANIGIAYPLVTKRIMPNSLSEADSVPNPLHLSIVSSIKVYNPEPGKMYALEGIWGNTAQHGAVFGTFSWADDYAVDTSTYTRLNLTKEQTLTQDENGWTHETIVAGQATIEIVYNLKLVAPIASQLWIDVKNGGFYDTCLIDIANYVRTPRIGYLEDNADSYFPMQKSRIEPNNLTADKSIPQDFQTDMILDAKIYGAIKGWQYFLDWIKLDGDQYQLQMGRMQKASDGTITSLLMDPILASQSDVRADSRLTFRSSGIGVNVSITIDITRFLTDTTRNQYWWARGEKGEFWDLALFDDSCVIYADLINKGTHVTFDRPAWLGDSITEINSKASVHYHEILASNWGSSRSDNLGISGSTVGSLYDPMSVRYTSIPKDADFISVFGGVNDFGRNQPLGKLGDTTNETFYGALRVLFEGIQSGWPTVPKIFISAIHTGSDFFKATNSLGLTQAPYEQAITEMTAEYGIPHLSLYHNSGVTFAIKAQSDIYSADTLHPNDAGQALIAQKIQQFVNYNFAKVTI